VVQKAINIDPKLILHGALLVIAGTSGTKTKEVPYVVISAIQVYDFHFPLS
jgi:hypothetical protein